MRQSGGWFLNAEGRIRTSNPRQNSKSFVWSFSAPLALEEFALSTPPAPPIPPPLACPRQRPRHVLPACSGALPRPFSTRPPNSAPGAPERAGIAAGACPQRLAVVINKVYQVIYKASAAIDFTVDYFSISPSVHKTLTLCAGILGSIHLAACFAWLS